MNLDEGMTVMNNPFQYCVFLPYGISDQQLQLS